MIRRVMMWTIFMRDERSLGSKWPSRQTAKVKKPLPVKVKATPVKVVPTKKTPPKKASAKQPEPKAKKPALTTKAPPVSPASKSVVKPGRSAAPALPKTEPFQMQPAVATNLKPRKSQIGLGVRELEHFADHAAGQAAGAGR
jgi:hypothetical protein